VKISYSLSRAFSTTGNIEGVWNVSGKPLVGLSEEQLNDCDQFDCGVFGGWPCRAYQYIIETGGLMSEADYPYCVGSGKCFPCMPMGFNYTFCGTAPEWCNRTKYPCRATHKSNFAAKISSWVSFSTDENQLAAQLVKNGPIRYTNHPIFLFMPSVCS
jgi:cathepsin F